LISSSVTPSPSPGKKIPGILRNSVRALWPVAHEKALGI
jgi:hypothetical protein